MSGLRYIIVGAGAVGGTVGGALARSGTDVMLVARGEHARVLGERGLLLRTPDGAFEIPVQVATGPTQVRLTARDVLVFATKTHQLEAALQQWADEPVHGADDTQDKDTVLGAAGELLPVLTALNGVVAEEMALRLFARVFGVCIWMPAAHVNPGEVIVQDWPLAGMFHVARWPATLTTDADRQLLAALADTWTPAGIRIEQPDDVAPWKYQKLLANLGNAVVALTGSTEDGTVYGAAREEGADVLRRAGIDVIDTEVAAAARADGPQLRPVEGTADIIANSSWQSLARNSGSIETDFLNGEIVRIAHRHGLAAPVNATLARLARDAARTGRPPGQYTDADLSELIKLSQGRSR